MDTAIVLQARMGSERLPGKVLADIAGRPMLHHCVERLRVSGLPIVIATTTLSEDDAIEAYGVRLGVTVIRGPELDVLGRFAQVVSTLGLTDLIRATADNPAVDIDAPRRVLDLRRKTSADHVVEHGLPYGTAVEAVAAAAIDRAHTLAHDPYDREHVTPLIRRDGRFLALDALAPGHLRYARLRFTVDTSDDLERMRKLFGTAELVAAPPVPLTELIAIAERPDVAPSRHAGSLRKDA